MQFIRLLQVLRLDFVLGAKCLNFCFTRFCLVLRLQLGQGINFLLVEQRIIDGDVFSGELNRLFGLIEGCVGSKQQLRAFAFALNQAKLGAAV